MKEWDSPTSRSGLLLLILRKWRETVLGSTYSFVIDTGAPEAILEPVILKRTRSSYIFSPWRVTLPYAGVRNYPAKFAKSARPLSWEPRYRQSVSWFC